MGYLNKANDVVLRNPSAAFLPQLFAVSLDERPGRGMRVQLRKKFLDEFKLKWSRCVASDSLT